MFCQSKHGIEHWVEIGVGHVQPQFSQNEQRMMNHYRLRFPTLQTIHFSFIFYKSPVPKQKPGPIVLDQFVWGIDQQILVKLWLR